jgi:hypothetical protein
MNGVEHAGVRYMKVRLSKKFVLILGGGLVLCGASGAAAVLLGTDKILGPSYLELNGATCTTLKTFKIRKGQATWIRQYVTSDQAGDGATRVKTALRVARAVQEKEKADLVQIAMIAPSGPKDQAEMRGRMIGAQVVYIPDLAKVPDGAAASRYSAYYVDGAPTSLGEYFGLRIDLPVEDVEHLEAKLTDTADCVDPAALAAASEHGSSSAHGKSGHGDASAAHGSKAEHGEEPAAGHGEAAHAEDHGAADTQEHGTAASDDHGEANVQNHGEAAKGHEAAPAVGHEAAAQGQGPEAADEGSGGFLSSITTMIFGEADEPAADAHAAPEEHGVTHKDGQEESGGEAAAAHTVADPVEDAHEPRTSAEGGKRWSKQSAADEIRSDVADSDHAAPDTAKNEAKPAPDGATEADAAGAAWLAKFRAEQGKAKPAGSDH